MSKTKVIHTVERRKDNPYFKAYHTMYTQDDIGGDSEIFDEYIDATDQQRNTALANVNNQTANSTTGKMGYKVLDSTKTFASQVIAENTIYEIRDVFDLGGTQETPVSVTLPAGSTLKFNGGTIKNCTIQCSLTQIQDDVSFDNVVITGSVKNDELKLSWWKLDNSGNDNTYALNNKNFQCLLTSSYNVSRKAVVDRGIRISSVFNVNYDLKCDSSVYYYGEQNISSGVLTLSGTRKNYAIRLINMSASGSFDDRKNLEIKGVDVNSLIESNIYIQLIRGFTTGLALTSVTSSDYSFGNNIYLTSINNCYNSILININGSGWITESRFLGGRLNIDSGDVFSTKNRCLCFTGKGITCDNLVFENINVEASYAVIYCNNSEVRYCKFINLRNERSTNLVVEENVNALRFDEKSSISLWRVNGFASQIQYKQFVVESNTDNNISVIPSALITSSTSYTNYPMCDRLINSGVTYLNIQKYYIGNNHITFNEDNINISSLWYGLLLTFEHNGRFIADIKCTKSTAIVVFCISKNYTTSKGYEMLDVSNITILDSNTAINPDSNYMFGVTKNTIDSTYHIALSNIPNNTYICICSYKNIGDIFISLKNGTFITKERRDIVSCPTVVSGYGLKKAIYYDTTINNVVYVNNDGTSWVRKLYNGYTAALSVGDTASRPTNLTTDDFGFEYADSDLGKKIMWSGSAWVNLDGTPLS